ncbi:hypothetical protein HWQ46_23175, partial [Shewanella sp. D64]
MKKLILGLCLFSASGCTVFLGQPSEHVGKFDDWELCSELADKTYKYHPSWSWAILKWSTNFGHGLG